MQQDKSPQVLTQARLKELLRYDPETGIFTRRVCRGGERAGSVAGCAMRAGYISINFDGKQYLAHRLAFLWMVGVWPEHEVDHINGGCADNRWVNLREVKPKENMRNRGAANKNNKSGLLGVCWSKRKGGWIATIGVDRKHVHLGSYPTPELAHAAYLKAKDELHPTHRRLRVAA